MATAKKTTRAKSTKASPKKATSRAKSTTQKSRTGTKRATVRSQKPRDTVREQSTVKPVEQPVDQPAEPLRLAARNTTHYNTSIRLERQEEKGKRRTELKPRGQRGDFMPLQPGDENDPVIQEYVTRGILELITQDEAAKVAAKQMNNAQNVHPALAMLRNERGEPYEDGAFQVAPSFEEQGIVVAELKDGQIAFDRGGRGGIVRPGQEATQERGAARLRQPGAAPQGSPYASQAPVPPGREGDAAADAKARKKGLQGPSAGLPEGMRVTVAPTQQT